MVTGAYAKKLGMTHMYDEKNRHVPVTILKMNDQAVTGLRTKAKDGYDAIQIGTVASKNVAKPQQSELKKNNIDFAISKRAELRIVSTSQTSDASADETTDTSAGAKLGTKIDVTIFSPGDSVEVTGISKGKGFSGTIKRYGWSRGPETHGSKNVRKPGSIGSGYPQRVVPGKKLPGHMGHTQITTRGLKVVAINEKDNTLAISGAIPGPAKGIILIKKAAK